MDQAPKFQGTLEKQGRMKTWTWKKYWFVLKENQLAYVKSQDKMASQGHIDLSQAHSARSITGNHGYPFEIVTKSRTHYLSASSADSRDKWVKVIHEAMAWSARNASRTGSINSTRASCNSIIDDDEELGYTTVSSPTGSNSPSPSSGYGSTTSSRESGCRTSNEMPVAIRDSETEDMMYFNKNYTKYEGAESSADTFTRNSGKSIVSTGTRNSSNSADYEDVDKRSSQHKGLYRLHQMKTPPEANHLPASLTSRESTQSDMSGIYDEVSEPMANLAISHIVQGYANIARNKGPGPEDPNSMKVNMSNDYDEVFDAVPRASKVVMRKSLQHQRDSDPDYAYAETGPRSLGLKDQRGTVPSYTEPVSEPDQGRPKSTPRTPTGKGVPSFRKSKLPSDVQDYFVLPPIPDIPNPRIELTDRSAFDDIRQFLANNRGPNEFYASSKRISGTEGEAIGQLRSYLTLHAG